MMWRTVLGSQKLVRHRMAGKHIRLCVVLFVLSRTISVERFGERGLGIRKNSSLEISRPFQAFVSCAKTQIL